MKKSIQPHIQLILEALSHIRHYQPADKETFLSQPMVQDAILMRLQVIGENLAQMRHIDEDAFVAAADDSWLETIGLRNVISHGDHTIKLEQIWEVVTQDLPAFAAAIDALVDRP